jgi:xanthine dehydrogenase small subunit
VNISAGLKLPEILLNGRPVSIDGHSVQTTLLDFLRESGLTGAKEGCAEGECGACSVLVVAPHAMGSAYRAINSCLVFLPMAAGQEIYTVESLAANGQLAEVQQALASSGGSQCGYCTPGFVVSLFAEQYRPDRQGACSPYELGGNLCRCTGYRPIRDAALSLGPPPNGEFLSRLAQPAPPLENLQFKNGEARFSRPVSIKECLELAAADPESCWVAGATDMGVESNLRFRRWKHLISLDAVAELREFAETPQYIRIGAALPLSDIAARWSGPPEAFRQWLPLFASPTLRNRATLGGNLATASPIGDGAPLLASLDTVLHLSGKSGTRAVPLASFFTAYRRTLLERGELLTSIEIPKPLPSFTKFYKVAKRRLDDISTVAASMAMDWDAAGRITRARFAFGGVAATPIRATVAEEAILGGRWNEDAVERVQAILDDTIEPIGDHRGSADYRREVAKSLVEKFWWESRESVS